MQAPERTRRLALGLHKVMTLPEVLLWKAIKSRRLNGLHFRKQHPIGPYVLDFYCDSARLCVEVDGYSHGTGARPERDERRDDWLDAQGIRTLRISAELVLEDVDAAVATIRQALES
ncbi:MAG: endonuclease domain-containing protein [Phenylobacterium sp.]|nr:endonuclease domain-containing protein [Phenylobacterium sp.]